MHDNIQTKNERKDRKTIAKLINEGRYSYPYLPEGIYADLRTASNLRFRITEELTRIKNRVQRWLSIYFPEYRQVYRSCDVKSGMMILKSTPLPKDISKFGEAGINRIWREAKLRGVGPKKAKALAEAAARSIGSREGATAARLEIAILIEEYEAKAAALQKIMDLLEELCRRIPEAAKMLEIKGIGLRTVSGFLAEVGELSRFSNPKQLQKLAGLALVEDSSGIRKGQTVISKRGRKRLRCLLFEAALSLVVNNPEFRELHRYYTTRDVNPLKKMQSLTAVACKLIRVFYAMMTKGVSYDAKKMSSDIRRSERRAA
jgi:transposase